MSKIAPDFGTPLWLGNWSVSSTINCELPTFITSQTGVTMIAAVLDLYGVMSYSLVNLTIWPFSAGNVIQTTAFVSP
jgi:hypothetical protein